MIHPMTTHTNTQALETVTEADREAAAALAIENGNQEIWARCILAGSHDDAPTVQAFARHRTQAIGTLAQPPAIGESGLREKIARIIYDNVGGAMMLLPEQSLVAADAILAALQPSPTLEQGRGEATSPAVSDAPQQPRG